MNKYDLDAEAAAARKCGRLIEELVRAIEPIQRWGGEFPGDIFVNRLIGRLRDEYGGWTREDGKYKKKTIPPALRAEVLDRDGYACKTCGSPDDLTIDHVYPESLGGEAILSNLRVLCRSCNSRKGARVADESCT